MTKKYSEKNNHKKQWFASLLIISLNLPSAAIAANPTLAISQTPLTLISPARPQVLIALANSESMDGTLSGAIMTGSGALSTSLSSLYNSSSPVYYTVPTNFTPPIQTGALGIAPYTVNQGGVLYDNGPSRLNVAKAGIAAILQSYLPTTDFALETYNTSNAEVYTTWVYYMSPTSQNFSFTNVQITGNRYVTNPCFAYLQVATSSAVASNCASIATLYGVTGPVTLSGNLYMNIGAASDDSNINDILYASGFSGIFVAYNGPNPASPYPPYFSLANYNNNSIQLNYSNTIPNSGALGTNPTNAGYVPFSQQVMFSERGFGYGSNVSATTGKVSVAMTNLGSSPTASALATAQNLFATYLNPETNQTSSAETKSLATQSPTAGLLTTALSYLSGLSSSGSTCPPNKYVILISDGLPTLDLSSHSWPPLGSASATGYGVTATFNADGSLNSTNDQALTDTISSITKLNTAGIKTFVVGLGAGVNPTLNAQAAATLQAMAVAGGTGNYYPAIDSTALVNDLNNILLTVQSGTYSTTSAAVSSSNINTGTTEYIGSFTSSDTPYNDWTGNLVAQTLNTQTGVPTGVNTWSAQSSLDTLVQNNGWSTKRFIATWNPTLKSNAGDGAPFEWANLSTAQQLSLQPSDLLGTVRLQYLRGSTALEVRNGGTFRNRSHILGDIVDSQATYVGTPSGPYLGSSSYTSFITTWKNRTPVIYVGSNDGMLHAFNANTGAEMFAYIPSSVIKNLYNLTATTYNQSHLFFEDGSPQVADAQFSDATWHTLLVSGQNGGGNSIFALDITNPSGVTTETILANNVLWEFTDADLGLTYSTPQIAPINPATTTLQTFAVFFGNGYNNPNNTAVLYAVNPNTGAILRKINLCTSVPSACKNNIVQGLSTVAVGIIDGIQGQSITQVYAGDLQGNLWAVDVSNANPALWAVRLLFQARDSSNNLQPITTQPLVTLQPLYPRLQGLFIMFATGEFLTVADITNTQTQTVYGVWDKPNASTVFTRSNLQAQTLTLVLASVSGLPQNILTNTMNAVSWAVNVGWFDDLVVGGQRIVSNPQLLSGAFIATITTPPTNVCTGTFSSMLLELNYQTGGAFYYPQLDINGSGTINSSDQYNGAYPVGMSILTGFVSQPTIIGPNTNNNMVKLFSGSGSQQATVINPNNSPRITSWWQIQ